MDFSTAVRRGIDNIGNFEGRAGRAEFWWFVLAIWVAQLIIVFLVQAIFGGFVENLLLFIVWVVGVLAYVSVGIRRLHDVGQSGWMVIFAFLGCLVIIPIIFWVQASNPGDNKFGPPPAA